ncbi:bifunctional DNA-formamidopyrimidine glycosylase/DNA-(apurinic or apyrimidinic site) lyase [Candidatus Shapirobacteria bacterium]|nr:bifunctional DNA-formamidopyrimidine glycosylase/DNA-(apurinic or apyrimidinic site) lyase [Candidatus Shapirobacteria bacterium]
MPELPEVEVVKIYLEDKLLHQQIASLDILNPKSFIGDQSLVVGQSITSFSRVGKQLSIYLKNGYIVLVHLKMTGQLVLVNNSARTVMGHPTKDSLSSSLPSKSTRIILKFKNNFTLYFNDQRKFGWIQTFDPKSLATFQSSLGHDIFSENFTADYLFHQLHRSSQAVKVVLLDQHYFAGIGNIYANDSLFLSRIHPTTPANKITKEQSTKIHQHLIDIMRQSVSVGGSTMKDNKYVRPDGTFGSNQFFFRVYQRLGEPCLICKDPIKKITLGGRGTFYCPSCQKLIG